MTEGFHLTRSRANDPAQLRAGIRPALRLACEEFFDRLGRTCAPSFHSVPSLCRAYRKGDTARKIVTMTNPDMATHNVG